MSNWKSVSEHPKRDDNSPAQPPLVLLWRKDIGYALGHVHHWSDGQIITNGSGYHGFEFSHYAELDAPLEAQADTARSA
jgi:hypothetical protein